MQSTNVASGPLNTYSAQSISLSSPVIDNIILYGQSVQLLDNTAMKFLQTSRYLLLVGTMIQHDSFIILFPPILGIINLL